MSKLFIFAFICSLLFGGFQAFILPENNVSIVVVDHLNGFSDDFPEYEATTSLNGDVSQFTYTFGKRVDGKSLLIVSKQMLNRYF